MHSASMAIAGGMVLLLVGMLTWNAEATPLAGTTSLQSNTSSWIIKAKSCRENPDNDQMCEAGSGVSCTNQGGAADCKCVPCNTMTEDAAQEPTGQTGEGLVTCTCRLHTCCNPGTGKWCCR